ncbi:hypothetical protein K0M31_019954 [Melipona bicolor]|uniref:Uncharacterized protein n=1 Tax=Melipona bicolor TaxID=60889 RepID=A0AA40G0S9_9HYME|nr:hypothetical protein K0M31_019954 [Melipona bicolor]
MSILFTEGEVAVPSSLTVTTDRLATFSRAVTKLNNATERVSRLLSLDVAPSQAVVDTRGEKNGSMVRISVMYSVDGPCFKDLPVTFTVTILLTGCWECGGRVN